MTLAEKIINGYYFEFAEQEGATILVAAFVTSAKPIFLTNPVANEEDRIQALQNMFRKLSGLSEYVVYYGNPEQIKAQGADALVTAIRGAVSRRSRARITIEEVVRLISNSVEPSPQESDERP